MVAQIVSEIFFQFLQTSLGNRCQEVLCIGRALCITVTLNDVLLGRAGGLLHLVGRSVVRPIQKVVNKIDRHIDYTLGFLISKQRSIAVNLLFRIVHRFTFTQRTYMPVLLQLLLHTNRQVIRRLLRGGYT